MYSHNSMNLNHQHWVDQVISAGGFNVHCAQGAEASHKYNMHIAAARVRHGNNNETQCNMLKYLCERSVFQLLFLEMVASEKVPHKPVPGLQQPLSFECGLKLLSTDFRHSFIHSGVRVSISELIILICGKLGLSPTLQSFKTLTGARIVLGQKFVVRRGEQSQTFWATDTERSSIAGSRRDMLFLRGIIDGCALGAEAICFVHISNLRAVCQLGEDTMDFVLIRWLNPHHESWERDSLLRPVAPGPFHVNNCLWKYAVTPRPRIAMVSNNGRPTQAWLKHRNLFGPTYREQHDCWMREKHAYFDLITPDTIEDTMHMCSTFKPGTAEPDYCNWMQTVALF